MVVVGRGQTDRQTDKQTDRQTETEADRERERERKRLSQVKVVHKFVSVPSRHVHA